MSYSRKLTREVQKKKFREDTANIKDKDGNKFKFKTWWKFFQQSFYGKKEYAKLQTKNKKKK